MVPTIDPDDPIVVSLFRVAKYTTLPAALAATAPPRTHQITLLPSFLASGSNVTCRERVSLSARTRSVWYGRMPVPVTRTVCDPLGTADSQRPCPTTLPSRY